MSVHDHQMTGLEGRQEVGTDLRDASRGLDGLTVGVRGDIFAAQERAAACPTAGINIFPVPPHGHCAATLLLLAYGQIDSQKFQRSIASLIYHQYSW